MTKIHEFFEVFQSQNEITQLLIFFLVLFLLFFFYYIISSIFLAFIAIFIDPNLTRRQRRYNKLMKKGLKYQKRTINENYISGKTDSKEFKNIYNKTK